MVLVTNLKTLISHQRKFYKSIVSLFCPILNETIYFTSDGFKHLLYESNRKPRVVSEQYMKLMCLHHAPAIIKNCTEFVSRKAKRKIKGVWKEVVRYSLVYEVSKGVKMRAVVERVGTGKCVFLSIMPHDKKSKHNNKKHP